MNEVPKRIIECDVSIIGKWVVDNRNSSVAYRYIETMKRVYGSSIVDESINFVHVRFSSRRYPAWDSGCAPFRLVSNISGTWVETDFPKYIPFLYIKQVKEGDSVVIPIHGKISENGVISDSDTILRVKFTQKNTISTTGYRGETFEHRLVNMADTTVDDILSQNSIK